MQVGDVQVFEIKLMEISAVEEKLSAKGNPFFKRKVRAVATGVGPITLWPNMYTSYPENSAVPMPPVGSVLFAELKLTDAKGYYQIEKWDCQAPPDWIRPEGGVVDHGPVTQVPSREGEYASGLDREAHISKGMNARTAITAASAQFAPGSDPREIVKRADVIIQWLEGKTKYVAPVLPEPSPMVAQAQAAGGVVTSEVPSPVPAPTPGPVTQQSFDENLATPPAPANPSPPDTVVDGAVNDNIEDLPW